MRVSRADVHRHWRSSCCVHGCPRNIRWGALTCKTCKYEWYSSNGLLKHSQLYMVNIHRSPGLAGLAWPA